MMITLPRFLNPVTYKPLTGNDEDAALVKQAPLAKYFGDFIWPLTALFFATTTIILAGALHQQARPTTSIFNTELRAIESAVELEQVMFTGELNVDDHGDWVRNEQGPAPQYVGPPSNAVDRAWRDLLAPINIDLRGSEALDVKDTFVWPGTDNHFTGLTVHHSVHCINLLRMAIYRDYYLFPEEPALRKFTWMHLDHCLDFVRQSIQCHADLTPMKWYWSSLKNQTVLKAEAPHTCRKWDKIQEWAMQRVHIRSEAEKEKHSHDPVPKHGKWVPDWIPLKDM